MFLGNERYNQAVDMWSLGCVGAELLFRVPLFHPTTKYTHSKTSTSRYAKPHDFLNSHISILGFPNEDALHFLNSLPSTLSDFGLVLEDIGLDHFANSHSFPTQLRHFVEQTLAWNPCARLTAPSASQHAFLTTPCLSACLPMKQGRDGLGSISIGVLLDEVLEFLQNCPRLVDLRAECRTNNSFSIREAGAQRRLKLEVVGHVENALSACNRLNSDRNPIRSERIASFIRALRRCARGWLQQLQERVRVEILRVGLPLFDSECPFMHEDFSEKVFGHASVEVINLGAPESAWHTDGGASLLDAGVTIFGSHDLVLKMGDSMGDGPSTRAVTHAQKPGSLYVGNLCALEHRLVHRASAPGSLGGGPPDDQMHIGITLRSDFFRRTDRSREMCRPREEFLHIVRRETARHAAEVPFRQPDLAAVVAEYPEVVVS